MIGYLVLFIGLQVVNGKDNENGVWFVVDEFNKVGIKVVGKVVMFKLVFDDDQVDLKVGVQVVQNFVDKGVVVVFGLYNLGVVILVLCVYLIVGVLILLVVLNLVLMKQGFKNIFWIGVSDEQFGGMMVMFVVKMLNVKIVVVIDDCIVYGQGVVEQFMNVVKVNGIKIVDQEYMNLLVIDFFGIFIKIKVSNFDVIFFGGYVVQGVLMVKQMKQWGLCVKLFGGDGICLVDMGKVVGEVVLIVYCVQGGVVFEKMVVGCEFLKKYYDVYYIDMQVYGVNYYDGMKLFVDVMVKVGMIIDKVKLSVQFVKLNYVGVVGIYLFDVNGDLKGVLIIVYVICNGLLELYVK